MRKLIFSVLMTVSFPFVLLSCGGSGDKTGSTPILSGDIIQAGDTDVNGTTPVVTTPNKYTNAVVTVSLSGILPAKSTIAGVGFSLRFPGSAAPLTSWNTAVTPSGVFQTSLMLPPVYTKTANAATGNLQLILAHSHPSGATGTGEIATIALQLPGESLPPANEFSVQTPAVVDLMGTIITGMNITVSSVEKRPAP